MALRRVCAIVADPCANDTPDPEQPIPSAPNSVALSNHPGLLLTRPAALSATLANRIRASGGKVWVYPTLDIAPLAVPESVVCSTLAHSHVWIFISANAVLQGWPLAVPYLQSNTQLAAVGQATAVRLQQYSGRPVLFPHTGSDSEALLALPELARPSGQKIVIIRGRGGREWLKTVLESRQAEVHYLECYERIQPRANPTLLDQALREPLAVSVQSAEALGNLWQMAGTKRQDCLRRQWFIVPHPRIAQAALKYGIQQIQITDPGDEALMECWMHLPFSRTN